MKTCCIIALVLIGSGLGLTIAGCSIGGAENIAQVVNDVTSGKVDVSLDMAGERFGIFMDELGNSLSKLDDGETYNIDDYGTVYTNDSPVLSGDISRFSLGNENVKKLVLNAGGCEFGIKESEDDCFWLEAEGVSRLQAYVKDQELHVTTTRSGKVTGSMIKSTKIILYVPEGYEFQNIEMELGAGLLKAEELQAQEIQVKAGAGEIILESLTAQKADLNVGMGDITVKNMNLGELVAEAGMGNMELEGSLNGDGQAKCSMGNITLKLDGAEEDFDYSISSAMGNVDLNGQKYSGLASAKDISNGAEKKLEAECSMGNIDIRF